MEQRTVAILEKQRQDLVVRVLKKHEEAEAGRLLTERILAGISEFFLLFDRNFTLLQANRGLAPCRQSTASPDTDKTEGVCLHHFFSDEEAERIRTQLLAEDAAEIETELHLESGVLPVRLRPLVHTAPDGQVLYILLCTDLSEFSQLMERIREGQKQLMHSSRLASLGEMTAGIGHELTQPLNTILLLARNALKMLDMPQAAPGVVRENLELIAERAERAGAIINTMRSFGRRVEGALVVVDVNALLRKIVHFFSGQLRLHEVELEFDLAQQALPVRVVEVRLEQVFLNLVQNAIQAMGGVERPRLRLVTVLQERLDVQRMHYETCVVIRVEDNGVGIGEELRDKIFDPFFTTRDRGGGMGLGLSLVDRIVRDFSGYVEVESSPDLGACFSVWLPLCAEQAKEHEERKTHE